MWTRSQKTKPNGSTMLIMKKLSTPLALKSRRTKAVLEKQYSRGNSDRAETRPGRCAANAMLLGLPQAGLTVVRDSGRACIGATTAGNVPRVRVDPAGFHSYLIAAENRRRPDRAAGLLELVSPVESGPVCTEWGDDWAGKVAFHPPVQDKVKR